ncbi:MAG: hypothetical protein HYV60_06235 [Planctomycetia bacterium]|nr:hypothetical protein [Planctomycetia bacterium]
MTAAWGLRRLAVAETLPAMLVQAEQQTKLIVDNTCDPRYVTAIDLQLSQLFQAFGERGYGEAESLMRKYISKTLFYSGQVRPAAVWAIGKLNHGKVDEELAKLLAARLADIMSMQPEADGVRRMSAIGIGRMRAESQLKALREFVGEAPGITGQACAWSIERMTGEIREFPLEYARTTADWFLVPRAKRRTTETD